MEQLLSLSFPFFFPFFSSSSFFLWFSLWYLFHPIDGVAMIRSGTAPRCRRIATRNRAGECVRAQVATHWRGGGGVLADCLLGSAGWARFGLMGGSVIYNFRGEFSEPFSVHKWWPWRPWRQPSFLFLVFVWIVFPRSNMEAYKQRQQVQHKNSHFILNIWIAERGKNSTFIYIMRFVKYSKVALK